MKKSQAGFTLLETLIYIALLSFFLASLLGITYQSLESSQQISAKITLQQEANFILRKMDWALTGAGSATSVSPEQLHIVRNNAPLTVDFLYDSAAKNIQMSTDNGVTYYPLNTINTKVTNNSFNLTSAGGANYAELAITLDGQSFSLKKYIR